MNAAGMRIVVAGGGTGGHLYPGIAIVESMRERDEQTQALFIGASGGMEEKILPGGWWTSAFIGGKGLRGSSLWRKLAAPFTLVSSVIAAMRLIRRFDADLVLGTGGYASAASVLAAMVLRVPRVLQEQNSIPGLVNRRLARFADLILLSYESSSRWMRSSAGTLVVGNPLRPMPEIDRAAAAGDFGLDPGRPTVLVIGGSRGAHSLNVAGLAAAESIADVQFILLCGAGDGGEMRARVSDAERVKVIDYLDDVWKAYAVADVAVARAGASTVFELARFGVPAIFVPYPHAADDHQAHNAAPLVERGAALVIRDEALGGALTAELTGLLANRERRFAMAEAMRSWSKPDAARAAADAVMKLAKKKETSAAKAIPAAAR